MKSFSYYDLIEKFAQPGCAVCRQLELDLERYLSSLLYEFTMEHETHNGFREGRGLCNRHSWMLLKRREGLISIAVLYEAAVDELLKALNHPHTPAGMFGRLLGQQNEGIANSMMPTSPCMCCAYLSAAEKRYMDVVRDGFVDARFTMAYQASDGFCLPHTVEVLRALDRPAHTEMVMNKQREVWVKLKAELGLFAARYGLRAEGVAEEMGEEATSWLRAIAALAGADGVRGKG
jgi:hypothetical protein